MAVLKNRAKMSTSTTGTGTITLGSAEDGYQTFADAGVANADVVRYVIEDGSNWEIGTGTYTSSGTTLSRTVSESSNADAAINLSGSATVFIGATAEDIPALYADNPSSATTPTASGANAIAIGDNTTASGEDAVAIGDNIVASGLRSISLGGFSDATGDYSVALGAGAQALGEKAVAIIGNANYDRTTAIGMNGGGSKSIAGVSGTNTGGATALGGSYAGALDSFAAAIGNNTSSYGATGAYSVALGYLAKSTGLNAMSFGEGAIASGNDSLALSDATASGNNSIAIGVGASASQSSAIAIGKSANSAHQNSVAIGKNAVTTAANQITLGDATATVRISETYTLPITDGTNGQVLTTDGSGAVTFADAGGGGADLYAAETTGSTNPTASGTLSIAIGSSAIATGNDSIAIGNGADVFNSRTGAVAIGPNSGANGDYSVAIGEGTNTYSGTTGSLAIGQDAQAASQYSVAIGRSRASGTDSFAAVITDNTSTYGAQGANSIAMGYRAKSPGNYSVAMGWVSNSTQQSTSLGPNTTAGGSGTRATAVGYQAYAGGSNTTAIGANSSTRTEAYADVADSSAIGYSAISFRSGQISFGNGYVDNVADSQYSITTLRCKTTNNTQTVMTTDNSTPTALNQINLRTRVAMSFKGMVVARESEASGTDCAAWEISGLIRQENGGASTTVLVNSAITVIDNQPNWGLVLSADTTLGGLKVQVTGASSTTIKWAAPIQCAEVYIP